MSTLASTTLLSSNGRRSDDGPHSDALLHAGTKRGSKVSYENVLDLDDEQLRGISLSTLLANGAGLFAEHGAVAREDPNGTFALSQQVLTLDYFCSHSWTTSRWLKYIALLVHFNLGRALIACLLVSFSCLFVQLWFREYTPSWSWYEYPINPDMAKGLGPLGAEILIPLVFVVVLCTAHRASPLRSLFLDIACIRQDSDAAKAEGIAALGAVLDRSERMLVLCDANYFSRLWCTFELAAYTKRAGAARIDLLPLHESLVLIGLVADLACFLLVGAVLGGILQSIAPQMMEAENYGAWLPVFMFVIDAPAQFFIILAQVQAYQGHSAVAKLRSFRLADAQCHSDKDREELQQLIAKWFTEQRAGEDDAEDTRRVGHHRFEQFVRHTVAPTLVSSRSHYLQLMLTASIFSVPPIFDTMCSDAFTANHVTGLIAMEAMVFALVVPMKLFIYWHVAGVVLALRERCRCPAVLAYGVGVLLNTCFGIIPLLLMFSLTGPSAIFDPTYRLPDDGLDSTGRKMLATQLGGIFTAIGVCAIAWVFKI